MRRWLSVGFIIGAGLGILILFGLDGWGMITSAIGRGNPTRSEPLVGSLAPDFELDTLAGQRIRLSDLRGSVVVINFWATWCGPCIEEMPLFQRRHEQFTPELRILAVNFAEPVSDVQAFTNRLGLEFDILLDSRASVQELYRVRGYPTTYIIDREGIIQVQHLGVMTEDGLDQYLAKVGLTR